MQPLLDAVAWRLYLQSSMLDQLFEAEVIPKWLDTLWVWLTAPQTNFQEISQWYTWWKDWFADQDVGDLTSVKQGLAQGLSMMNQALDLGEDAQYRCVHPVSTKFGVKSALQANTENVTGWRNLANFPCPLASQIEVRAAAKRSHLQATRLLSAPWRFRSEASSRKKLLLQTCSSNPPTSLTLPTACRSSEFPKPTRRQVVCCCTFKTMWFGCRTGLYGNPWVLQN